MILSLIGALLGHGRMLLLSTNSIVEVLKILDDSAGTHPFEAAQPYDSANTMLTIIFSFSLSISYAIKGTRLIKL